MTRPLIELEQRTVQVETVRRNGVKTVQVTTRGAPGPAGPPGVGSLWRQGAGVPAAELGAQGDFYLRTSNGDIYGPKTSGGWGSVIFSIAEGQQGPEGPAGPAGADGKTLRSGAGQPAAGLGVNGDFYIDTAASVIYGPKAAGAWPAGVSLIGATGPAGAQGPAGPEGADGKTVLSGTGAPAAGLGTNGDFYLDTAASRLYGPKTGGAWGSGVVLIGPTGAPGAAGAAGADGKTVRSGSGAPAAGLGVDGDFYINTAANTIYGPKASGAWGSPTSLVGPTGGTGPQGPAGVATATAPATYDPATQTVGVSVGTTAGTAAAGNDARFHDAVTLGASVADVLDLTGQVLSADDPGADRLLFWDDSEGKLAHATPGSGIVFDGATLRAEITTDPTGVTGADKVTNIISLTQAEYDAIATPNASTLYIITD